MQGTATTTMRVKHVPLPYDADFMLPMAEIFFQRDCTEEETTTVDAPSQESSKDASGTASAKHRVTFATLSPPPPTAASDPMIRFLPYSERSFTAQMSSLSRRERSCVEILRQQWEADHQPVPGIVFLRFARFHNFNIRKARKGLQNFDTRYLTLTVAKLGPILQTKTLFPVPRLKSKDGLDMFYMRPSRYFPRRIETKYIIDNLAYVMFTMVEKEASSKNGIGFLACMDDWTMENFSVDYCFQFMMMLQGGVPARVGWFLIVNPPSWFGAIWKLMKPMLAPKFRWKVKMIPESKLPQFLAPGYEEFLPNDMQTGQASTSQMIRDFVAYRRLVEQDKPSKK